MRLRRRLTPLYVAIFLQNLVLWVSIEKLFMTSIGFDAASVGLMAAVYSMVVPLFEVPSGILADRWSRRGVLILASVAALVSVVIGGLSQNVAMYMVSAVFLGLYFAMQSGTVESVVYDTVLEETGGSDIFERTIGRIRLFESSALVVSALAGGVIAQFAPLQLTYFLTAPLLLGSCVAFAVLTEPRLHKVEKGQSLRTQIATTYRILLQPGRLRAIVALTVTGALLMQSMMEFGALWLVAFAVPAVLYGPHWAGLTAALGIGGLLGSRGWLTRRTVAVALAVLIAASCVALALSRSVLVVVSAQVLLTLLVVAAGIPVLRRLHDSVPSSVRAGVSSGVGTLTWVTFLPFALIMGWVGDRFGVPRSGWVLLAVGVVAGILIITVLPGRPSAPVPVETPVETSVETPVMAPAPAIAASRFVPDDDPDWAGHWADPPRDWQAAGLRVDADEPRAVVREAIAAMPPELRQVIVLRDVRGVPPEEVSRVLGIEPEEERSRLHRARGLVRAELERYFEQSNPPVESTVEERT